MEKTRFCIVKINNGRVQSVIGYSAYQLGLAGPRVVIRLTLIGRGVLGVWVEHCRLSTLNIA